MKRVLTAVILVPLVVIALFKAPIWLFALLVFGVAVLAAKEYFDIAEASGYKPFRLLGYVFIACLFGVYMTDWGLKTTIPETFGFGALCALFSLTVVFLPAPLIFLVASLRREPLSRALPDSAISLMALPYVGGTLVCLIIVRATQNGAIYLLFSMLLVWVGDIAALYVGRAIGKHKLAPRVSPGKTWEGAAASVLGAIVLGVVLFRFIEPIAAVLTRLHLDAQPTSITASTYSIAPVWMVAAFAICINIAAQVGDLVESALKRGAGLKDSGSLLPGHGGVLDRIDALLFAMPVAACFYFTVLSDYFQTSGIR